jgi:flagellar M-ring protein FliF
VQPGQNAPPAPPTAASPPLLPGRGSETTNYEISRTTKHTIRPRGDLARLSVAVIVDNEQVTTKNGDGSVSQSSKPRSAEQLQKITGLVAAAVGLDTERGDHLTVDNVPFEEAPVEAPVPSSMWQRYAPPVVDGVRTVAPLVLGILAIFFVVRPLMRRVMSQPLHAPALAGQLPPTIAELEAQLDEKGAENRKLPVLTKRVSALTTSEPENAARLIRMWIGEDHR